MADSLGLASGLATDAGVRGNNEDAAYAGRYLFAVADGVGSMGLGGDVASATAIDTLAELDVPTRGGELVTMLQRRIGLARSRLRRLCDEHSSFAGTTLTAMLWSGRFSGLRTWG